MLLGKLVIRFSRNSCTVIICDCVCVCVCMYLGGWEGGGGRGKGWRCPADYACCT